MRTTFCIALSCLLLVAGSAFGVDGVIEINQAIAAAGSINGSLADDPAGFPVVITQPGSYRLTSDLVPGVLSQTAIQVNTSEVSIDLNRFAIRGPWTGGNCGTGNNGIGIFADSTRLGISVNDGRVSGMSIHGIALLGNAARIERIAVLNNCTTGVIAGKWAHVSDTQAFGNRGHGIVVEGGSIIVRSIAASNNQFGILGNGPGVHISDSTADSNLGTGIHAELGGLVARSVARNNGTPPPLSPPGISASLVLESTSTQNHGSAIEAPGVALSLSDGGAIFSGGLLGCVINAATTVCPYPGFSP